MSLKLGRKYLFDLHRYWQKYPERYFRDIFQSQKQLTGQADFFLTQLQFQNCEFVCGNQKCLLQIPKVNTIMLILNQKLTCRKHHVPTTFTSTNLQTLALPLRRRA